MAGREDQRQTVVADRIVQRLVEVGLVEPVCQNAVVDLVAFAGDDTLMPKRIEAPALPHLHQPGAGIARDAVVRPLRQGGDQRLLRQFLGAPDIAGEAGQPRDQPRRFDAPDHLDGAVCIAARHGRRYTPWMEPLARGADAARVSRLRRPRASSAAIRPRRPARRYRRNQRGCRSGGSRSRTGRASDWDSA